MSLFFFFEGEEVAGPAKDIDSRVLHAGFYTLKLMALKKVRICVDHKVSKTVLHPVVHAAEDDVSIGKEHVLPELSQAPDPAPSSGEVSRRADMLQIAGPGTQGFLSCLIVENCSDFGMERITIIHVVSGYLPFVQHFQHMEIVFVNGHVLEAGPRGQVNPEDIEGHRSQTADILRAHSGKCREDADLAAL